MPGGETVTTTEAEAALYVELEALKYRPAADGRKDQALIEDASFQSRVSDPDDQPYAQDRHRWECDRCGGIQFLTWDEAPYCSCVEDHLE
jgi:hypothetical protein